MVKTKPVLKNSKKKMVKKKPEKKKITKIKPKTISKVISKTIKKIKPEKKVGFFKSLFRNNSKKKTISKVINDKQEIKKVVNGIKKDTKEKINRNKKSDTKKKSPERFVKTGIKGFDVLFDKGMGIPNGNAILIEGGPGSGKTIFCLATINELCKQGKKCLYMSFEESEEQLVDHMKEFNWDPEGFIKKGLLRIQRFDAIDISRSIEALLSAAKKELLIEIEPMFFPNDYEPDFVVIDSLTSIASAFSGEESRFRVYMEQLFRYLEKNKITNFLIREVSSPSHVGTTFKEQGEAVSFLSDGIIVIYNVIYDSGQRSSAIEVLKMRGVSFLKKIVEFKIINKKGIEINPNKILKKTKKSNFILT